MGSGGSKKAKSESDKKKDSDTKQSNKLNKNEKPLKVDNDIIGDIKSRLEIENICESGLEESNDNFMYKKNTTNSVSRVNHTNKNIKKAGDLQQSHDIDDLEEINLDGVYFIKKYIYKTGLYFLHYISSSYSIMTFYKQFLD